MQEKYNKNKSITNKKNDQFYFRCRTLADLNPLTQLHCLRNKDTHMQHLCRRCLTTFSSQLVLIDHIDRCQKQKPTNITFSYKNHIKFEDYHMRVPVPIRVYADFEHINQPQKNHNVFFK